MEEITYKENYDFNETECKINVIFIYFVHYISMIALCLVMVISKLTSVSVHTYKNNKFHTKLPLIKIPVSFQNRS